MFNRNAIQNRICVIKHGRDKSSGGIGKKSCLDILFVWVYGKWISSLTKPTDVDWVIKFWSCCSRRQDNKRCNFARGVPTGAVVAVITPMHASSGDCELLVSTRIAHQAEASSCCNSQRWRGRRIEPRATQIHNNTKIRLMLVNPLHSPRATGCPVTNSPHEVYH